MNRGKPVALAFDPELVAWAIKEAREREGHGLTQHGIADKLARAVLMLDADATKENEARKVEIRELQGQRDAAWTELEQFRGSKR